MQGACDNYIQHNMPVLSEEIYVEAQYVAPLPRRAPKNLDFVRLQEMVNAHIENSTGTKDMSKPKWFQLTMGTFRAVFLQLLELHFLVKSGSGDGLFSDVQ